MCGAVVSGIRCESLARATVIVNIFLWWTYYKLLFLLREGHVRKVIDVLADFSRACFRDHVCFHMYI